MYQGDSFRETSSTLQGLETVNMRRGSFLHHPWQRSVHGRDPELASASPADTNDLASLPMILSPSLRRLELENLRSFNPSQTRMAEINHDRRRQAASRRTDVERKENLSVVRPKDRRLHKRPRGMGNTSTPPMDGLSGSSNPASGSSTSEVHDMHWREPTIRWSEDGSLRHNLALPGCMTPLSSLMQDVENAWTSAEASHGSNEVMASRRKDSATAACSEHRVGQMSVAKIEQRQCVETEMIDSVASRSSMSLPIPYAAKKAAERALHEEESSAFHVFSQHGHGTERAVRRQVDTDGPPNMSRSVRALTSKRRSNTPPSKGELLKPNVLPISKPGRKLRKHIRVESYADDGNLSNLPGTGQQILAQASTHETVARASSRQDGEVAAQISPQQDAKQKEGGRVYLPGRPIKLWARKSVERSDWATYLYDEEAGTLPSEVLAADLQAEEDICDFFADLRLDWCSCAMEKPRPTSDGPWTIDQDITLWADPFMEHQQAPNHQYRAQETETTLGWQQRIQHENKAMAGIISANPAMRKAPARPYSETTARTADDTEAMGQVDDALASFMMGGNPSWTAKGPECQGGAASRNRPSSLLLLERSHARMSGDEAKGRRRASGRKAYRLRTVYARDGGYSGVPGLVLESLADRGELRRGVAGFGRRVKDEVMRML